MTDLETLNAVRTPVVTLDRKSFASSADMVETISTHLSNGEIVHVVEGNLPAGEQLRYIMQLVRNAGRAFDSRGRSLGVFANLDALVEHAEIATARK